MSFARICWQVHKQLHPTLAVHSDSPCLATNRWRWLPWGYGAAAEADTSAASDATPSGQQASETANSSSSGSSSGSSRSSSSGSGQQAADRSRQAEAEAEAEAALLRAVGVVPSFARAVAAELRSASDQGEAGFADPPADMEAFAFTGPAALAAYPAAAAADDPAVAESLLARALAVSNILSVCMSRRT